MDTLHSQGGGHTQQLSLLIHKQQLLEGGTCAKEHRLNAPTMAAETMELPPPCRCTQAPSRAQHRLRHNAAFCSLQTNASCIPLPNALEMRFRIRRARGVAGVPRVLARIVPDLQAGGLQRLLQARSGLQEKGWAWLDGSATWPCGRLEQGMVLAARQLSVLSSCRACTGRAACLQLEPHGCCNGPFLQAVHGDHRKECRHDAAHTIHSGASISSHTASPGRTKAAKRCGGSAPGPPPPPPCRVRAVGPAAAAGAASSRRSCDCGPLRACSFGQEPTRWPATLLGRLQPERVI